MGFPDLPAEPAIISRFSTLLGPSVPHQWGAVPSLHLSPSSVPASRTVSRRTGEQWLPPPPHQTAQWRRESAGGTENYSAGPNVIVHQSKNWSGGKEEKKTKKTLKLIIRPQDEEGGGGERKKNVYTLPPSAFTHRCRCRCCCWVKSNIPSVFCFCF